MSSVEQELRQEVQELQEALRQTDAALQQQAGGGAAAAAAAGGGGGGGGLAGAATRGCLGATLNQGPDAVVQWLLEEFGPYFTTRKPDTSRDKQMMRSGSIQVQKSGVLTFFGQHLALAGYDNAVDELVAVLLKLQEDFTELDNIAFQSEVQLCRVPGAPGIGKTTFASAAWDLILPRMQHVKQKESDVWAAWRTKGSPEQLLTRLMASWSGTHGPLVFTMDMSTTDYCELLPLEAPLHTGLQVAARMLWAAVDTTSAGIKDYRQFLSFLTNVPEAKLLAPEAVQHFVIEAAGVPKDVASSVVWVWDEVNAVEKEPRQNTTFCQQHLSQAVVARTGLQTKFRRGGADLLPVLVACTTRGSSTSLALTASRKARVLDLQVPTPEELEDKLPLVFMDLLRRLEPQPASIASQLQLASITCSASLSELTNEQRKVLADLCPWHVRKALEWAGGNVRSATYLLGAVSGQPEEKVENLWIGRYEWLDPGKAPELHAVVNTLMNRMEATGWHTWLSSEGHNHPLLVQLVAYSLCNVQVSRTFSLPGTWSGECVKLEQLEKDGVVQLVSLGEKLEYSENPDLLPKRLVLPPALLAAYIRRIRCTTTGVQPLPTLQLVQGMIEGSRMREHDDLTIVLLRLHMYGDVLGRKAVQLAELLPTTANTSLGDIVVKVPDSGYLPTLWPKDLPQGALQFLKESALADPDAPWCWLLNGSCGPDSWMVLRHSRSEHEPADHTGGCVVLHLQSKLRQRDSALKWQMVMEEVLKVQPQKPDNDVVEVLVMITDQRPPRRLNRKSSGGGSSSGTGSSEDPWPQIVAGKAVYLAEEQLRLWVTVVFREQQWQVRGGAALLYDMLRLDHDPELPHDFANHPYSHPLLLAKKTGKPGRPKLKNRPEAIEAWKEYERKAKQLKATEQVTPRSL